MDPAEWDPTISSHGYASLYIYAFDVNGEDYQQINQEFTITKANQSISLLTPTPLFNNQSYPLDFLLHNPFSTQYAIANHELQLQIIYPNGTTSIPIQTITNETGHFTCLFNPLLSGAGNYLLNITSSSSNCYYATAINKPIYVNSDPKIDNRTSTHFLVNDTPDSFNYGTEGTIKGQLLTQNSYAKELQG